MARVLRGDIVWANLNPVVGHEQAGRRPVVVLSADVFNEHSGTVIAMALTSQPQRAGFPLVLELESVNVGKPTCVKISLIRTLSTRRLGKKLGRVSPDELQRLVEGLNEIITAYLSIRRFHLTPATCSLTRRRSQGRDAFRRNAGRLPTVSRL